MRKKLAGRMAHLDASSFRGWSSVFRVQHGKARDQSEALVLLLVCMPFPVETLQHQYIFAADSLQARPANAQPRGACELERRVFDALHVVLVALFGQLAQPDVVRTTGSRG